jgi:hypothetical protein
MCPDCGVGKVKLLSMDDDGAGTAAFVCLECGWQGDKQTFTVPCTACGCKAPWRSIELDAECNVVCRACYLKDPPAEDILGMFHDAKEGDACAANWLN